jgi:hypothetical protein
MAVAAGEGPPVETGKPTGLADRCLGWGGG